MKKRDYFLNTLRTALAVRLAVAALHAAALPAVLSLVGGPEAWATTDTTFAAPLTTVTQIMGAVGVGVAAGAGAGVVTSIVGTAIV